MSYGFPDPLMRTSTRSPAGSSISGQSRGLRRSRSLRAGSYDSSIGSVSQRHYSPLNDADEDSFIPQVPQIPREFIHRQEEHDSPQWQNEMHECGADEKKSSAGTRYLPTCSVGKPNEIQVISNSMMKAYVAMRGNLMGGQDGEDPLFSWIQQREELEQASGPKIDGERDVLRMLELIDKALGSQNTEGDSSRDGVFEVYRPGLSHIEPPQDMDMSPRLFDTYCPGFEWDDPDDEDPGEPSGRISPCTFLEWSKGCVRWNGDLTENQVETSWFKRTRPLTPEEPAPPRQRYDPLNIIWNAQRDIHTGEELTPEYIVPNCPSILYTPPGIDFVGFRSEKFHGQYRRMVPLIERELRKRLHGGDGTAPKLSDDQKDRFTPSEVNAAVIEAGNQHMLHGPQIEELFADQWAAIRQAEAAEMALQKHAEIQRRHIERLRFDRRHLDTFLPALQMRREQRDQRIRDGRKRADTIRAYISEYARDAQCRLNATWCRLQDTRDKVTHNTHIIAGLQQEIGDICSEVGVRDAEHAFEVLMGEDSAWSDGGEEGEVVDEGGGGYAYRDGQNDPSVGIGVGGPSAGVDAGLGRVPNTGHNFIPQGQEWHGQDEAFNERIEPIRPCAYPSLNRAGEDFDRLLARWERQADEAAVANGLIYDPTHEGCGDSGVGGVASQARPGYLEDELDEAGCF